MARCVCSDGSKRRSRNGLDEGGDYPMQGLLIRNSIFPRIRTSDHRATTLPRVCLSVSTPPHAQVQKPPISGRVQRCDLALSTVFRHMLGDLKWLRLLSAHVVLVSHLHESAACSSSPCR